MLIQVVTFVVDENNVNLLLVKNEINDHFCLPKGTFPDDVLVHKCISDLIRKWLGFYINPFNLLSAKRIVVDGSLIVFVGLQYQDFVSILASRHKNYLRDFLRDKFTDTNPSEFLALKTSTFDKGILSVDSDENMDVDSRLELLLNRGKKYSLNAIDCDDFTLLRKLTKKA